MPNRTFKIWRGNKSKGEFKEYSVKVEKGMVILDVIHSIQANQAGDLAARWNCKAGKCGSCSVEINGKFYNANVQAKPLYDPDGKKMRG